MPVRLQCKCEAVLALNERYIGRKARCPECRWEFIVPEPIPGVEVVPPDKIQAFKKSGAIGRPVELSAQAPKQELSYEKFKQMLGEVPSDAPALPEDLPVGEIGGQLAANLAPEKTATEIFVEQAFMGPAEEYRRLTRLLKTESAPHLFSQLGDVCLSLGKRHEAIEAYEKAMDLDSSYDFLEKKIEDILGPVEYGRRIKDKVLKKDDKEKPAEPPDLAPEPKAEAAPQAEPSEELEPLRFSIKDAIGYPFRGTARISLITCTLLASAMWFAMNRIFVGSDVVGVRARGVQDVMAEVACGTLIALFFFYVLSYMLRIILTSAEGLPTSPSWPRLDRWWGQILQPTLSMLFHLFLCVFVPAWLLNFVFPMSPGMDELQRSDIRHYKVVILAIIGFLYLPMAALVVMKAPGLGTLSPIKVISGICGTFRHYLAVWLLFALCLGSNYVVFIIGKTTQVSYPLDLPGWFLFFCFAIATSRALGSLYRVNQDLLGWKRPQPAPIENPAPEAQTEKRA